MKKKMITSTLNSKNPGQQIVTKVNVLIERFESQKLWHIALLLLLPFFIYIKVTSFQFISNMDDSSIIIQHFDFFTHFKNILLAFKSDAFINQHGDFYRPLQTVTFMIDAFFGGENPWIYHFTNLIYHLLTVIALYFLLYELSFTRLTAFFAALLFSVHPLLSSAVSWIPARGDLLVGLFGALLFITFISYIKTKKLVYILLHTLLFSLALFSKEVAVLFPILFIFYYVFVGNKSVRFDVKEITPFVISWLLPFLLFYVLRNRVVSGTPPSFILGFSPFVNNITTIPILLSKSLFPFQLSTMPLFDKAFTLIGSVLLVVAAIMILKFIKQKKWLAVLGFTWFLFFIIPPMFFKLFFSHFIVEYYEHRAYLPLIGLMIVVAILLDNLRANRNLKIYTWLPISVVLLFTFLASSHSDDFKDTIAFFSNATDLGNPGACARRGEYYAQQRDFANAMNDFEKSIELSKEEYPLAFFDRGTIKSSAGKDHKGAEEDFTRTIALDPNYTDAYIKRAEERVSLNNFEGALNDVTKAKQLDSNNVTVYYTNAKVLTSAMKFADALPVYNKAILMDSSIAEIFNDRAYVKYRLKDYDNAIKDCDVALKLFPQFMNAYYNKGVIYLEMNKPKIAIKEFDTTLSLTNNFTFGYFYRGMAKKQLNDMKGACTDWNESVKLGFTMAQDTIAKYCK